MAAVERLMAHGGWAGVVVEAIVVLALVLLLVAIWARERRGRGEQR